MNAIIRNRALRTFLWTSLCVTPILWNFSSVKTSASSNVEKAKIRSDVEQAEKLYKQGKWGKSYRIADSVVVSIRANGYDRQGTRVQIKEMQDYLKRGRQTMDVCASHFAMDASDVDEDETLIFEF